MRRALGILSIAAVLVSIPSLALTKGNANFVIGQRSFDEDDLAPVEDQQVLGINIFVGPDTWPVNLAVGIFRSEDDGTAIDPLLGLVNVDVETLELSFGVAKVWDEYEMVRPYIGVGIALIEIDAEITALGIPISDDDNDTGFYANVGIFWRVGERFNIGIDARILVGAEFDLITGSGDLDYEQVGLTLGWGW